MPTAYFKLRVCNPNKKDMAEKNTAHIKYIGERKGTLIQEEKNHGLFGIINGTNAEKQSMKEIQDYIFEKTENNTNMYRSIISLSAEDAINKGFDEFSKWEELIRSQIPKFSEMLNIKIQNIEWAASVHMKKSNPHCHILFYDKEQKIKEPFINQQISTQLRNDIIKEIYENDFETLYNVKNIARDTSIEKMSEFYSEFVNFFSNLSDKDIDEATEKLKVNPELGQDKLMYEKFSKRDIEDISKLIFDIYEKLPNSGRINMRYLDPELKEKVEKLSSRILSAESNIDCRLEVEKYIKSSVDIASFYFTDNSEKNKMKIENIKNNAKEDIQLRINNKLVKEIFNMKKNEIKMEKLENYNRYREQASLRILNKLFKLLARCSRAKDEELKIARKDFNIELSKQAKREYALKENSMEM